MTLSLLAILVVGSLQAQDSENDPPTGPSGDFNGDVTTAGSYDPYTGNAKRVVTDLVVPNSPLAFTRYYNSRLAVVQGDVPYFGDGSNWRHAYQWTLTVTDRNGAYPSGYAVAYPDGRTVTYRHFRTNTPEPPPPPGGSITPMFWRGPMGTEDRLDVNADGNIYLYLADGTKVEFMGVPSYQSVGVGMYPQLIVDPNGAVTKLDYQSGTGYLTKVTEPAGRFLTFSYITVAFKGGTNWVLLQTVQASTGQSVFYTSVPVTVNGRTKPYYVLNDVRYDYESSVAGGSSKVHSTYTYVTGSNPPDLQTAFDPHYGGAMVSIRYEYSGSGFIYSEQNINTQERVSILDHNTDTNTNITTSAETRGDQVASGVNLSRNFKYGEPTDAAAGTGSTNAKTAQVTTVTDFEGHSSSMSYYGSSDSLTNGTGNLRVSMDANGHATTYQHEAITGKVTAVVLQDGRTTTSVWRGTDGLDVSKPYYLDHTVDERGRTVQYHRNTNTGLVSKIGYPDGGCEYFSYQGFYVNGNSFYKVSSHTDQRGAQTIYAYDEPNHGGNTNGYLGLLTSVTRKYTDKADGTGPLKLEKTDLTYDTWDRLIQSTDQRGVTESFIYNDRHQLLQQKHGLGNTHVDFTYADNGNRLTAADELGHTTTTVYDEYRRVTKVTVPVSTIPTATNRVTRFTYDVFDNSFNRVSAATTHTRSAYSITRLPSGKAALRVFSPIDLQLSKD